MAGLLRSIISLPPKWATTEEGGKRKKIANEKA
jgi:hypothetical protein